MKSQIPSSIDSILSRFLIDISESDIDVIWGWADYNKLKY